MNISVILKNLKKNCQVKKSFIVRQQIKKISDEEYDHVLKVWNKFEMKTVKDYHDLLQLAEVFEIIASRIMDYVQVII